MPPKIAIGSGSRIIEIDGAWVVEMWTPNGWSREAAQAAFDVVRESERVHCILEGDAMLWSPGEAWVFDTWNVKSGVWRRVNSSDEDGRVITKAAFEARFPKLPPLPAIAFQRVASPPLDKLRSAVSKEVEERDQYSPRRRP